MLLVKSSRKIAYCAAATAIAVVCAIITLFSPAKLVPLLVCALCFYIAAISGGIVWGLISIAATALITFFAGGGVSMTAILLWIVFAPYSVLAYFMRKINYRKTGILIRVTASVIYANLALAAVYGLMRFVILSGGDLDIMGIIGVIGGYWVLAIVASLLMISFDFLFVNGAIYVEKTLKLNIKAKNANVSSGRASGNAADSVDKNNYTQPSNSGNAADSVDKNNYTQPSNSGNAADSVDKNNYTQSSNSGNAADSVDKNNYTQPSNSGNAADSVDKNNYTQPSNSGNAADSVDKNNYTQSSNSGNAADSVDKNNYTQSSNSGNAANDMSAKISHSNESNSGVKQDKTTKDKIDPFA